MSGFKRYPLGFIDNFVNIGFFIVMRALVIFLLTIIPISAMSMQNERLVVLPFEIVDSTPLPGGEQRNE
jgi:hypothetical protein